MAIQLRMIVDLKQLEIGLIWAKTIFLQAKLQANVSKGYFKSDYQLQVNNFGRFYQFEGGIHKGQRNVFFQIKMPQFLKLCWQGEFHQNKGYVRDSHG